MKKDYRFVALSGMQRGKRVGIDARRLGEECTPCDPRACRASANVWGGPSADRINVQGEKMKRLTKEQRKELPEVQWGDHVLNGEKQQHGTRASYVVPNVDEYMKRFAVTA